MSNILIGYSNYIDAATLSGGSWSATLTQANIKNRLLAKVARTANALAASSIVDVNLTSAKTVKAFGVIATNISASGATYRIRGSNDNTFATSLYDSGTVSAVKQTPNIIIGIAAGVVAQYWRLEITNTSNAAGYIQIGRIFIGNAFIPTINYSYNGSFGYRTTTGVVTSIGEIDYFDQRPLRKSMQLSMDWLTNAEEEAALSLIYAADIDGEVLVVPNPDDTTYNQRNNFLARLAQLSPLQNPYYNINKTAFDFLEIV